MNGKVDNISKWMNEREAKQNGTFVENKENKDKSQPSMQGGMNNAPAQVAPQFDTGSTNLLAKFKQ